MSFTSCTRNKSIGFHLKTLSLAVASALFTLGAHAAGLGELKVHSYLGQPLRAEVELVAAGSDGDAPMMVKLASYEVYQKANIEFNPLLHALKFSVEQRGERKVVRISSTQPINEPFVDMLLELRSGNNAVVREYVFLLDPASLISSPVVAVEDETAAKAAAAAMQRPTTAAQPEKPAAPAKHTAPPRKTDSAQATVSKPAPAASAGKPRLTLSSPKALEGNSDDESGRIAAEYAAMEKAVAEANARVLALEQRVADMQKLLEVTNSLLAEMQKQNALALAAVPQPSPGAAATPPAPSATSPAVADATPADTASTPAPTPAPAAPAATPKPVPAIAAPAPPPPEEDWWSDMLLLPGVAMLLAGLGAVGVRVVRRRKQEKPFEDSLFAASTQGPHTERQSGNSLATRLTSLLPTTMHSDEVDTVAEADVYIAYGRDGQAEELLKEALKNKPGNRAISMKLMTIYATRKDHDSFAPLAHALHRATGGEGKDWAHVAEMGRGIEPDNPLYEVKAQAGTPRQDTALQPLILEKVDDEDDRDEEDDAAAPLMELKLDQDDTAGQPASPASTTLTAEEEQLAELLSHPLMDNELAAEPAPENDDIASKDMDVDQALKQLDEPVFHATPEAEAQQEASIEAGIGPIDFEVLVPEIRIEQKEETVPAIPSVALETPTESTNLIEFDFLQPAKGEDGKSDELPEIPLALPVETADAEEEAKLFKLEFLDEKATASDKT
ncbi:MAG TPA: hypothetical protein VGE12_04520 [Noviherbaspirillum sp.]